MLIDGGPDVHVVGVPVAAYITGGTARFDVAEGVAQTIFSSPDSVPTILHAAQIGRALIAVRRGDMLAASEAYGALQPIAGTMAAQGNAVDRVLGLLSQTMGRSRQLEQLEFADGDHPTD